MHSFQLTLWGKATIVCVYLHAHRWCTDNKTENALPPRGNEPHPRGTPMVRALDEVLRIRTNPRFIVTANKQYIKPNTTRSTERVSWVAHHVVEHVAVGSTRSAGVRHLNSGRKVAGVCVAQEDLDALAAQRRRHDGRHKMVQPNHQVPKFVAQKCNLTRNSTGGE